MRTLFGDTYKPVAAWLLDKGHVTKLRWWLLSFGLRPGAALMALFIAWVLMGTVDVFVMLATGLWSLVADPAGDDAIRQS